MEHLEYVEREASKNMEHHIEDTECLNKEAHTTLSFLFVVISAAFAGAVRLFEAKAAWVWPVALAILCIYLSVLAFCLTFTCLMARDIQPPANEPKNLKLNGNTLREIREAELENLQRRIELNQERNKKTGTNLNRIRLLICATPVLFIAVVWVIWVARPEAFFR
jgi:hypothetical protein